MGDDPTTVRLEEHAADMAGMESALFMPSGTMDNLATALAHCDPTILLRNRMKNS